MKAILLILFGAAFLIVPSFATDGDKSVDPPPQVVIVGSRVPDTVPFTEGLTVSQAILRSGGYVEFAAARVFLIRNGRSTKVAIREILKESHREKDILLKPWDIIHIR